MLSFETNVVLSYSMYETLSNCSMNIALAHQSWVGNSIVFGCTMYKKRQHSQEKLRGTGGFLYTSDCQCPSGRLEQTRNTDSGPYQYNIQLSSFFTSVWMVSLLPSLEQGVGAQAIFPATYNGVIMYMYQCNRLLPSLGHNQQWES